MNTTEGALLPCGTPGQLTASVVLATEPGPALPYVEQRLLARFVEHLDRRVHDTAPPDEARAMLDRLFRLTAIACRVPVAHGLVLLSTATDSALLHLRGTVRDRIQVGPAPSADELGLQRWPSDAVAVAVLTESAARCLVLRDGVLQELTTGLPLRRDPTRFASDHLSRFERLLLDVLDDDLPLVLAGEERVANEFLATSVLRDRVAAVLPGDTTRLSPGPLLGLALQRADRREAVSV